MCVCIFIAVIYEENGHSGHQKTKPIQTQLKPKQTQFKANKAKNKPKTNPIAKSMSETKLVYFHLPRQAL